MRFSIMDALQVHASVKGDESANAALMDKLSDVVDNETPAQIAKRTGVDLRRLLDENRDIKGLRRNAKPIEGTVLYLPTDA